LNASIKDNAEYATKNQSLKLAEAFRHCGIAKQTQENVYEIFEHLLAYICIIYEAATKLYIMYMHMAFSNHATYLKGARKAIDAIREV